MVMRRLSSLVSNVYVESVLFSYSLSMPLEAFNYRISIIDLFSLEYACTDLGVVLVEAACDVLGARCRHVHEVLDHAHRRKHN